MKKDVFQNCPTYQSERFEIRKMEMKDAHGLFQCYSNPQAARYFNGDCCGDDFYYTDYEKFLECEYYGAAEPPVRCGESHLSGLTEPPVDSYSA